MNEIDPRLMVVNLREMSCRCGGILHLFTDNFEGIKLTLGLHRAEVRPLKGGKGFRYYAPGVGWTSCGSLSRGLRFARRALRVAVEKDKQTPIPWRTVAFYDNLETGGTMGYGVEALDMCYADRYHSLVGTHGSDYRCTCCLRHFDKHGPNAARVDDPIFSGEQVAEYDDWRATGS